MGFNFNTYEAEKLAKKNEELAKLRVKTEEYCREMGIDMYKLQKRQWRFIGNGKCFDAYLKENKWHDIKKNQRGTFTDLVGFLMITFI